MIATVTEWWHNMSKRSRRKKRQEKRKQEFMQSMGATVNHQNATALQTVTADPNNTTATSYRACHRGPKEVMQIGNVRVWAGSYREVRGDFDWDIILRLSDGDFDTTRETQMLNSKAREVFSSALNVQKFDPAIIDMIWPDFGDPRNIEPEWWERFNRELLAMPPSIMLVHCFGGHGRTGTALSILAALNGKHMEHPMECPVEFVRARYCDNAVESDSQLKYVTHVTGIPVKAQANKWSGYGYGYGGFGFGGSYAHHHHNHKASTHSTNMKQGLYVPTRPEPATYDPYDQEVSGLPAGSAYTMRMSDLKGSIEASWQDDGKDYIFADDKVFQVVEGGPEGKLLLELDWSSGSYSGTSEHRVRTGGM